MGFIAIVAGRQCKARVARGGAAGNMCFTRPQAGQLGLRRCRIPRPRTTVNPFVTFFVATVKRASVRNERRRREDTACWILGSPCSVSAPTGRTPRP